MPIVLAAGISAGASLLASNAQSKAAKAALGFQQQAQQNIQPFVDTGKQANNLLASFYGLNNDGKALSENALAGFKSSPDYQFAFGEGQRALENSAASKGGLLGGNQMRAGVQFGQGLATQNLGNYLQRISDMANRGVSAGGAALTGANNMAQTQMGIGQAQGSGFVGVANAANAGVQNTILNNYLSRSSFGGGGNQPMNLLAGIQ